MTGRAEWTPEANLVIAAMRAAGHRNDVIAERFGVSKTAIKNQVDRLRLPPVSRPPAPQTDDQAARTRLPHPAGHRNTWGAISNQPWPGDCR